MLSRWNSSSLHIRPPPGLFIEKSSAFTGNIDPPDVPWLVETVLLRLGFLIGVSSNAIRNDVSPLTNRTLGLGFGVIIFLRPRMEDAEGRVLFAIPHELRVVVLAFLPPKDLCSLCLTHRSLRNTIEGEDGQRCLWLPLTARVLDKTLEETEGWIETTKEYENWKQAFVGLVRLHCWDLAVNRNHFRVEAGGRTAVCTSASRGWECIRAKRPLVVGEYFEGK